MSEDDDMKAYGYEGEIIAVLIPKEKQELKKPRRFKVIIINDDYTPMEFVVGVLTMFFNKTLVFCKKMCNNSMVENIEFIFR